MGDLGGTALDRGMQIGGHRANGFQADAALGGVRRSEMSGQPFGGLADGIGRRSQRIGAFPGLGRQGLHRHGENAEGVPRRADMIRADGGVQRHSLNLDFDGPDLLDGPVHPVDGFRQARRWPSGPLARLRHKRRERPGSPCISVPFRGRTSSSHRRRGRKAPGSRRPSPGRWRQSGPGCVRPTPPRRRISRPRRRAASIAAPEPPAGSPRSRRAAPPASPDAGQILRNASPTCSTCCRVMSWN